MQSFLSLGLTGKKLSIQGSLFIILGLLLALTGLQFPLMVIRLIVYLLFIQSLLDIILRLIGKGKTSEHLLTLVLKAVLLFLLAGSDWLIIIPSFVFCLAMGIYEIFTALVNLITYALYRQNAITPRFRLLTDGVWLLSIGVSSLFVSSQDVRFQALFLGLYLILYGASNLRDGLFYENEMGNSSLRRQISVSLPMGIAAWVPLRTLKKINSYLAKEEVKTAPRSHALVQLDSPATDLTVFVHISSNDLIASVGHVDLSYKGKVYAYGIYDMASLRLFGAIGDGVLFTAEKEAYIDFCLQQGKTLFAYDVALSEEQRQAVEDRLQELEKLTYFWQPDRNFRVKTADGQLEAMYLVKMQDAIGAKAYKFTSSKFKTYFTFSTNCVQLADSILGKAGTDILSAKGFITPGTYQSYLEPVFTKNVKLKL